MLPVRRLLVVCFLLLSAAPYVPADTLTRQTVRTFRKGDASSAFDTARRHLVVVGGVDPDPAAFVQVLDLSGTVAAWTRPAVAGTPPPAPLLNAPAVYDPVRDRMIVLEGTTMWSLSLGAPMAWTQSTPTGTAPTLPGAQVIYDPVRDRIVGFGRDGDASTTWALSLGASPTWSPVAFVGPVPPWRTDGAVAYDPTGDRMIVTLGQGASGDLNDTWQLTFGGANPAWSQLATTGTLPAPGRDPGYAFDPVGRTLYLGGGEALQLGLATPYWSTGYSSGPEPGVRTAPAAAWDGARSRMIVAGGLPNYGDLWQRTNAGWFEIPASGGFQRVPTYVGYDRDHHRFAALVLNAPAFLSVVDSSWTSGGWTIGGPSNVIAPQMGIRFYDPQRNLFVLAGGSQLETIHPGVDTAWTQTVASGSWPTFVSPGTTWLDTPNHRLLVFGGQTVFPQSYSTSALYALDYVSATWSILQASTPLGHRSTVAMHDPRRNRLLFFGGALYSNLPPPGAYNDLHALDLATFEWSVPAAQGVPPSPRYLFSAAYDSLRDRSIVFGGITYGIWLHGVYYLEFGAGDPNGAWSRHDPDGEGVPDIPGIAGDYDLKLDRYFVPDQNLGSMAYYELSFGAPGPPLVAACPPSTVWTPGASLPLTFRLRQSGTDPVNYAWSLSSQRAWPGFPLTGIQQLSDTTAVDLQILVPVPDTVAVGIDNLTFRITDGTHADSCTVAIGDAASPVPWALVGIRARLGRVELAWWTTERSQGDAEIERRAPFGEWETVGRSPVAGDGSVRYEDADVVPGARYAYRAGIGGTWSEEAWVAVPVGGLAFAGRGTIARGALTVAFTLPVAAPARLEAFDLAGRRVAARDLGGLGAGVHSIELAPAGTLRGGVYFLRLTQGGARATTRAVVLSGRE